MTGYAIRGGYNSAWSHEEVDAELKVFLEELRKNPEMIAAEVVLVEPGYDPARIADFAEMYRRDEDLTCKLERDKDDRPVIRQLASGGGEDRDYKEACRRAVVRLATKHMHRKGMEISFTVA